MKLTLLPWQALIDGVHVEATDATVNELRAHRASSLFEESLTDKAGRLTATQTAFSRAVSAYMAHVPDTDPAAIGRIAFASLASATPPTQAAPQLWAPDLLTQIQRPHDDQKKPDEPTRMSEPAYVRVKSWQYIRLREMLIDWEAYRFRDSFSLYEVACLLNRMEPRAVLDEAWLAIRMRGGVAAEVLNNPDATAEMLHLNPANFYAPPVGYNLVRLKRAFGSELGVFVKAERLPALATMLGKTYPPELERESTAPATPEGPIPAAPLQPSEAYAINSAPASVTGVIRHSTKTKGRDTLDPMIELAQSKCRDPKDTAQVWAQLQVLAQEEHPPFLGIFSKGLKYTKGVSDEYFNRGALDKRLHPEKRQRRR